MQKQSEDTNHNLDKTKTKSFRFSSLSSQLASRQHQCRPCRYLRNWILVLIRLFFTFWWFWSWPFGDFDLAGIWTETFWAPDRSPCHVSPRFSYKSSKTVSTLLIALARSGDTRTASTLLLFFASGSFHVWRGAQLGKMSSLPFTLRPLKNSDFHLKFLRHFVTFFILFCAICVRSSSGALLGLLAAAVFMLAVLPILLKAKEDQVEAFTLINTADSSGWSWC